MAIAVRTNRRHVVHRPPLVRQRGAESSAALSVIVVVLLTLGVTSVLLSSQLLDVSVPRGLLPSFGVKTPTRPADGAAPVTTVATTSDHAADAAASPNEETTPAPATPSSDGSALAVGARARVANTDNLGVVFYAAPRDNARQPAGLMEGMPVTVLELAGTDWARVQSDSKKTGWVRTAYLAPAE